MACLPPQARLVLELLGWPRAGQELEGWQPRPGPLRRPPCCLRLRGCLASPALPCLRLACSRLLCAQFWLASCCSWGPLAAWRVPSPLGGLPALVLGRRRGGGPVVSAVVSSLPVGLAPSFWSFGDLGAGLGSRGRASALVGALGSPLRRWPGLGRSSSFGLGVGSLPCAVGLLRGSARASALVALRR